MSKSLAMSFRDGSHSLTVTYSRRDLEILCKPLLAEGEFFIGEAGVFENFSVAGGARTETWGTKPVAGILAAARKLLPAIERDQELLSFNYYYRFAGKLLWSRGARSGFQVDGKPAFISARRPGHIYLQLSEIGEDGRGHPVKVVDLRNLSKLVTYACGDIYIRKKKQADTDWPSNLKTIIDFLEASSNPEIELRHHAG